MHQWIDQLQSAAFSEAFFPMPPSVNKYWRHCAKGVYLSSEAKSYRREIQALRLVTGFRRFTEPVLAVLVVHPNGQSCDLDNYEKAFWDALQSAGILYNDCQVVCVLRYWGERRRRRGITLRLAAVDNAQLIEGLPGWSDQTSNAKDVFHDAKRKPRSQPKRNSKHPAKSRIRRVGATVVGPVGSESVGSHDDQ